LHQVLRKLLWSDAETVALAPPLTQNE